MNEYIPGQRWISDAELQMGLGTILKTDHRTVTVLYPATEEVRTYAKQTAPLTRVEFTPGDIIRSQDDWSLEVSRVEVNNGMISYIGIRQDDSTEARLDEGSLDNLTQLNRPADRLLTGQIDKDKWFKLRYETLAHNNRLINSDLRGLTGVRTSLIPHQLYIAHEVANRYAPRVLLADEVGLGKTIEAGLIIHQQLITEQVNRVLIIVPGALLHQWLIEMLRRFNLHFAVFNEERCLAVEESDEQENPFDSEQLVICTLDFLTQSPKRLEQAKEANWDLLIVDEAHHLEWSEEAISPEYSCVESLATATKGVILLTATPEQLGKASHFARLRLLDPDRFSDYNQFIEEERHYEPIANAIEELLSDQTLSDPVFDTLNATVEETDNAKLLDILRTDTAEDNQQEQARIDLIEHLLDRHGTGRVLFRNTRSAVKGFPERQVTGYPLPIPADYEDALSKQSKNSANEVQLLLSPELAFLKHTEDQLANWTDIDPRINWLGEKIKQIKPNKVLVITADADSALDISTALRIKTGIHAAVFHEHMNIIERDRAAAYFADKEFGTQVMVCSEIGSEGRNFQFAHHLVLFDLPINPDLLEQRIGRLDRIGQTETIQIHVPYLENTAQATIYRWYQEGLAAFEHTCPAGHNVFVKVYESLIACLLQADMSSSQLDTLISNTHKLHTEMTESLHRGRDKLLEYNSCRPHTANALKEQAQALDSESNLLPYLEQLCDCFGIDIEDHSENSYIIRPTEHMQEGSFPGLHSEGMTITCDRDTALSNEDMHFITWEHPLITGSIDLILTSELGNSSITAIKTAGLKPGTLLMECVFILETSASMSLQSARYLPPATIRIVLDQKGNDYADAVSHAAINQLSAKVGGKTAREVIRSYNTEIREMIDKAKNLAEQKTPQHIDHALQVCQESMSKEIERLKALKLVNPNVRQAEIDFFSDQLSGLITALNSATLRLDSQRIVITT